MLAFALPLRAQTANVPVPAPTDTKPSLSPEYTIGIQDVVAVAILESPELSREVRIGGDGTVNLPLLPSRLKILGLTIGQAEILIAKSYREAGILNDPNVTISVKELNSKPVTISGAVRSPGVFQVAGQSRLMRVLSQAGGFGAEAGTAVQVIRRGVESGQEEVTEVKISDLRNGVVEANIPIYGGDSINVLPAGAIFVVGAVNSPGRYLIQGDTEDLTVLRALALSNDLKRSAKAQKSVILRPNPANGQVDTIPVDITKILARKSPDVLVMAKDVLFVPDSTAKRALARGMEAALQIATASLIIGRR